ncbi:MAG: hypothetical protein AAGA26_11690 [Pseudomonadota bacterium]
MIHALEIMTDHKVGSEQSSTNHQRLIGVRSAENVTIVANDGGSPRGTEVDAITLGEDASQVHFVALDALELEAQVHWCNVVIGHAA